MSTALTDHSHQAPVTPGSVPDLHSMAEQPAMASSSCMCPAHVAAAADALSGSEIACARSGYVANPDVRPAGDEQSAAAADAASSAERVAVRAHEAASAAETASALSAERAAVHAHESAPAAATAAATAVTSGAGRGACWYLVAGKGLFLSSDGWGCAGNTSMAGRHALIQSLPASVSGSCSWVMNWSFNQGNEYQSMGVLSSAVSGSCVSVNSQHDSAFMQSFEHCWGRPSEICVPPERSAALSGQSHSAHGGMARSDAGDRDTPTAINSNDANSLSSAQLQDPDYSESASAAPRDAPESKAEDDVPRTMRQLLLMPEELWDCVSGSAAASVYSGTANPERYGAVYPVAPWHWEVIGRSRPPDAQASSSAGERDSSGAVGAVTNRAAALRPVAAPVENSGAGAAYVPGAGAESGGAVAMNLSAGSAAAAVPGSGATPTAASGNGWGREVSAYRVSLKEIFEYSARQAEQVWKVAAAVDAAAAGGIIAPGRGVMYENTAIVAPGRCVMSDGVAIVAPGLGCPADAAASACAAAPYGNEVTVAEPPLLMPSYLVSRQDMPHRPASFHGWSAMTARVPQDPERMVLDTDDEHHQAPPSGFLIDRYVINRPCMPLTERAFNGPGRAVRGLRGCRLTGLTRQG